MEVGTEGFPRQADGVVLQRGGGEVVLADREGHTHALNETALALWELCDGRTAPEEMTNAICVLFAASREVVEKDVDLALRGFTALGLLEWSR